MSLRMEGNMDNCVILKSSTETLELINGKTVNLTLNFKKLLNVKNKKKDLYKRYNKAIIEGMTDTFDVITILYTAYLCCLDDIDTAMTEETFMEMVPPYVGELNKIARNLVSPKKQEASEKHSEAEKKEEENE